jgi:hypothetical protein
LIITVAGWTLLLLVLTYVSVRGGAPTVREQRSIAEASPVADRAVGELVAAAAVDPDVAVELPPRRLSTGCRLTPIRSGASLERDVVLRTTGADGPGLLERIAQRLPAGYRAGARRVDGDLRLRADAGEFVAIAGQPSGPGTVTISVTTGCRPASPKFRSDEPLIGLPADQAVDRVLGALGGPAAGRWQRVSAPCPGGGQAYGVHAVAPGTPPASLTDALRPVAGATAVVVTDQAGRYAYRAGPLSVLVEATDGEIRVAATTGCPVR